MKKAFFILVVALATLQVATAQVKLFGDKKQSYLQYHMNHPLHSWTGETRDFTAVIITNDEHSEISQVAVTAKISSFDSKNANRDSHTMEVTEAIKYPAVSFASTSIVKEAEGRLSVTGNMIFHGVTKSISFEAEVSSKGKSITVAGSFSIKMTDYDIERPSLMGMATDDEIKIDFKTVF